MKSRIALCCLFAGMAVLAASPAAIALEVGDPAPDIAVTKWVSKTPVTLASAKGKLLVVEFWATWCGPCKMTIPHLNTLHAKYQDKQVVFAGITREKEAIVLPFIKETPMHYHVGIDGETTTHAAYMKGVPGIPHAVVVDGTGKVAWQGHPMGGMDAVIEQLLAGTFDPQRAKTLASLRQKLQAAYRSRSIEKVLAVLDETIQAVPDDPEAYRAKRRLLIRQKKHDEADALLLAMTKACATDADVVAEVATVLATRPDLERRNMPQALTLAHQAVTLTEGKDADTLAVLARVHYELGHLATALATAEKAVAVATGTGVDALKARVGFYRAELARRGTDADAK